MRTIKGKLWVWDKWIQKWCLVRKWHFGVEWFRRNKQPICKTKDYMESER